MSIALLAIGVNETGGGLVPLQGAVLDAERIAAWARDQRYDTVISITDGDGTPVTAGRIYDAVDAIVNTAACQRLIIYFAGHGVLQAQESELWLLTRAPRKADEAVNLAYSIRLARNSGIPHVVLISDACRTLAQRTTMAQLAGSPIFPNLPTRRRRSEVDVFYATLPGDPSAEAPDEQARDYQGVFTSCLLDGLRGNIRSLRRRVDALGAEVVSSRPLKNHLVTAVPLKASSVSRDLDQTPDVIVESAPELFLARFPYDPHAPPPAAPAPAPVAGPPVRPSPVVRILDAIDPTTPRHIELAPLPSPREAAVASAVARVEQLRGRESFETGTGFTAVGMRIHRVDATGRIRCDVFQENGADHVRVHGAEHGPGRDERRATSALITFEDGSGVCFAVLPGFVGTILVEPGTGTAALNYTPVRSSHRYADFADMGDAIERRRAHAAVAARMGLFRLDRAELVRYADQQRSMKFVDPALGIYACYALARAGALDEVRAVRRYMVQDWGANGGPIPFDVEMLAEPDGPPAMVPVPPGMPMLTQGWPLLGAWQTTMPESVREAQRHLLPSLWTTFNSEGRELIATAFERGEL